MDQFLMFWNIWRDSAELFINVFDNVDMEQSNVNGER